MINIVVPMAGRGSRFSSAGFKRPKPLILVHGRKPMIQLVVENLRPKCEHRFIFVCLKEHLETYNLETELTTISNGCAIVSVSSVTEGAACTVLLAKEYINNGNPLMIANSDQWIDFSIDTYLGAMEFGDFDGYIMTMTASDPKWSYLKFDEDRIIGVVEKEVVSDVATVGIYNFKKGSDFVSAAEEMIAKNLRVNNEFYVAPVYNSLISQGKTLGYTGVGTEGMGMYGLGIPEDLEKFERNAISKILVQ